MEREKISIEQVVTIQSSFFCAGVVIHNGRVIDAAPILRYMKGWPLHRVIWYAKKRGFDVLTPQKHAPE